MPDSQHSNPLRAKPALFLVSTSRYRAGYRVAQKISATPGNFESVWVITTSTVIGMRENVDKTQF